MFATAVAKHLATVDGFGLGADPDDGGTYHLAAGDDVPVFVGYMPDQPDTCVAIMPDGGRPQLSKIPYDLPAVQLLARAVDPAAAHDVAMAGYGALNCLDHVTLDDGGADEVFLVGMTATQSHPIPLGPDDARRHEFAVNFDATITAPTTNRTA